jgi:hypothetical protein
MVVKGYLMVPGIDYNETFAPVVRIKTLRILLAICAEHDMELDPFDVKTAFLSADMDSEIYVTLPPAFNTNPDLQPDAKQSTTAHRLLKCVPGIPQGSRLFNDKMHKVLLSLNFTRAPDDYCLYVNKEAFLFLALWTDDGYIFHTNQAIVATIKKTLQKHFDIKFFDGNDFDMLGVQIKRDRPKRTITLSQSNAKLALLEKAGMKDCKAAPTPVATNFVFTKADCPATDLERADMTEEASWYRCIVASLIYFVKWTGPHLAFAHSKLSKFMQNPGPNHVKALKRLLRYIKGTIDYKLVYSFESSVPETGVYAYFDSAHNDDVDTCRSTMAYLFFYKGCIISWFSKLHTYVTTSTNHSEYVCCSKAAREAVWFDKIFHKLRLQEAVRPIALFGDSTGAIAMTYNPVHHEANKHVALADHYAREQVELGIITVTHVTTENMLADALTKALSQPQFVKLILQFMN